MISIAPDPLALDIRAMFLNSIFGDRADYAHSILHIALLAIRDELASWYG